jgi:Zn ribbon nucleic-acid-binding protein
MWDAEGFEENEICPKCGGSDTVTYRYSEGFSELECRSCGHSSEVEDIAELTRYGGELVEGKNAPLPPPIPIKKIRA